MPVLHCISSFEGTYKMIKDVAISSFYFWLFCISSYPSEDIIFYNFSEVDSKLSKKWFLSPTSLFSWIHPNPHPAPLTAKIHEYDKSFLLILRYSILALTNSKYEAKVMMKLHCGQGDVLSGEQEIETKDFLERI